MMGTGCPLTQGHETLHFGHVSRPAPETRWSPARVYSNLTRSHQHVSQAPSTAPHTVSAALLPRGAILHCLLNSAARIPARLNSQLVQELPCHRRHYLRQCCVRLFSCIWPFRRIRIQLPFHRPGGSCPGSRPVLPPVRCHHNTLRLRERRS